MLSNVYGELPFICPIISALTELKINRNELLEPAWMMRH